VKNIIKIFVILLLLSLHFAKSHASVSDSLFATVGNKALTKFDILKELKLILIINGQSFSEDRRAQLESAAVSSAIKNVIKRMEIEKYNDLSYNKDDVNKEIARIADNLDMDTDLLRSTLLANEIEFSYLTEQIQTELLWNSLIFKIYKDRISINIEEIDEQLELVQNAKEIYEYLISEIIVKPVTQDLVQNKIDEVREKIKLEGFEQVAIDLSISETGLKGGDLGWINENVLSKDFKSKIITTKTGEISEPVILKEGILFFKVRDKRKVEKFSSLENAKNQLVKAQKTKILNMYSLTHYDNLKRSISIEYY